MIARRVDEMAESTDLNFITKLKRNICTASDISEIDFNNVTSDHVHALANYATENMQLIRKNLLIKHLAHFASKSPLNTKQSVYDVIDKVCSTPEDLFSFMSHDTDPEMTQYGKKHQGFGRVRRKAISRWYNSKDAKYLAEAVTKYKRRKKWSHCDLIKLTHVKPKDEKMKLIFKYIVKGWKEVKGQLTEDNLAEDEKEILNYLHAIEEVKNSRNDDALKVAAHVAEYKLTFEHIPTWLIKDNIEVWKSLLHHMPVEDIFKYFNKMAALRLLDQESSADVLIGRLEEDVSFIQERRVRPMEVMILLKSYESGRSGPKGEITWHPNPSVISALSGVFEKTCLSFQQTDQSLLFAVQARNDLQRQTFRGVRNFNYSLAVSTIATCFIRTEPNFNLVKFANTVNELNVQQDVTFEHLNGRLCEGSEKLEASSNLTIPIKWAIDSSNKFQFIIICTYNLPGNEEVCIFLEQFKKYQRDLNLPTARLVLITFNMRTCDMDLPSYPVDAAFLAINGMHPAAPDVIWHFLSGKLDDDASRP